jgi:hypothetical protein
MTRRELNLAIFEGTADRVLWQPRLETWISDRVARGIMPNRFRGMSVLEIYDELRCSIRYPSYHFGDCGLRRSRLRDDLVKIVEEHPNHFVERLRTPRGEITTVFRDIWEGDLRTNRRIEQFPVKTVQDLAVWTDLIERERFEADPATFEQVSSTIGHRGEPTIFLSGSGFTRLIKTGAGLPGTCYLWHDHPAEVEAYLEACDRRDDRLIEAALQLPAKIFNLGDHATNEFTPPPILEKYLMPRWRRIADRLHAAGRYVHTHWDGNSRLMLPYLQATRLDAVEALTPEPMGDMTLEMIKRAVGDRMVVLDLLPVIDFLPNKPLGEMLDFARRVIDTFAPRLILGVSDEISPAGEIERIEAVGRLVDEVSGLAD